MIVCYEACLTSVRISENRRPAGGNSQENSNGKSGSIPRPVFIGAHDHQFADGTYQTGDASEVRCEKQND